MVGGVGNLACRQWWTALWWLRNEVKGSGKAFFQAGFDIYPQGHLRQRNGVQAFPHQPEQPQQEWQRDGKQVSLFDWHKPGAELHNQCHKREHPPPAHTMLNHATLAHIAPQTLQCPKKALFAFTGRLDIHDLDIFSHFSVLWTCYLLSYERPESA